MDGGEPSIRDWMSEGARAIAVDYYAYNLKKGALDREKQT